MNETVVKRCQETLDLLEQGGSAAYFGEEVTQLQHALQAAHLARSAKVDEETILAALLHDIGHLLEKERHEEIGVIDHDAIAMTWLREHGFGERLVELAGGHVQAKRYLVATHADYRSRLSAASQRTLAVQGGPMTAEESRQFENRPLFRQLLRLRAWDEQAKDPTAIVPQLEFYRPMLMTYLAATQRGI